MQEAQKIDALGGTDMVDVVLQETERPNGPKGGNDHEHRRLLVASFHSYLLVVRGWILDVLRSRSYHFYFALARNKTRITRQSTSASGKI
jgi:hypothetical protein